MFRNSLWCVPVCTIVFLCGGSARAGNVADAARQREARWHDVAIEYTLSETVAAGAISDNAPAPFKSKGSVPERETVLSSTNRVALHGDMVRLEYSHPGFFMPSGRQIQDTVISYFNGTQGKTYYPKGRVDSPTPSAIIESSQLHGILHYPWHYPLAFHYRGSSMRHNSFPLASLQPTGTKLVVDGAECEEYTLPAKGAPTKKFWFTANQEALLRRVRSENKGKVEYQTDIKYRNDPQFGWVVATWTHNRFSNTGQLTHAMTAEVTKITQEQFPDSHFDVIFPEGCQVYDQQSSTFYRALAGGAMLQVDSSGNELGTIVYHPSIPWYRRNLWLLLAASIALLGIGLWGVKRWRSHKLA